MKLRYLLSVLTMIVIAVLSLMPAQEFPETDVPFADKWVHWVMYGFLTAVMIWDSGKSSMRLRRGSKGFKGFNVPTVRTTVAAMLISALYGGLMEILQQAVTTTRSGDWLDALADAFGAVCAGVVFIILRLCSPRKV